MLCVFPQPVACHCISICTLGTQLRQTSETFIQWKAWDDGKIYLPVYSSHDNFTVAGAWGLNFISEDEAIGFLDACAVRYIP